MFGIGPEDIWKAWGLLKRSRYLLLSVPQRAMGLRRAESAARSTLLAEYLRSEFPTAPFLECEGRLYPVAVFRPRTGPRNLLTHNPLALDARWAPQDPVVGRAFYWLQRSEIGNENRRTFIMKSVDDDELSITCGVADFFSGLRSAQALEWELHQAVAAADAGGIPTVTAVKRHLRLRHRLLKRVGNPLLDGNARVAPVGVSVLLAYRDESDSVRVFLRRRGPQSIVYNRGRWHAFPSGMFQAPCGDYDVEFSLMHFVLWEYLEELFDVPDPQDRRDDPKWFYSQSPVTELQQMLDHGDAQLWFTGVAMKMGSFRPEILLVLYISRKDWYSGHETGRGGVKTFRFSKEIAVAGEATGELIRRPVLHGSAREMFKNLEFTPEGVVPVGAAAVWLGIEALNMITSPGNPPLGRGR